MSNHKTASFNPGGFSSRSRRSPEDFKGRAKIWLDDDGRFKFGKHKGEYAEDVADEDPDYVQWALDEAVDMCDEDRDVLESLMGWKGGY